MSIENLRKWSGKDCCDFPQPRNDEELKLDFAVIVNENHRLQQRRQWNQNYDEARIGAAVGAEKRKARKAKRTEQDKKISNIEFLIFIVLMVSMLLFVGAIEMGLII